MVESGEALGFALGREEGKRRKEEELGWLAATGGQREVLVDVDGNKSHQ